MDLATRLEHFYFEDEDQYHQDSIYLSIVLEFPSNEDSVNPRKSPSLTLFGQLAFGDDHASHLGRHRRSTIN